MVHILDIHGRQIIDSRGNPTLEVDVSLSDGTIGITAVPSGASTGEYINIQLRDRNLTLYNGLSFMMRFLM